MNDKIKNRLFTVTIWWAVIGAGVWIGGTLFMMLVIDPQWSSNPPESVKHFFTGTEFNKYIWYFFGPPFMIFRSVAPQFWSLMLCKKQTLQRRLILVSFLCTLFTIFYTLIYIYPINNILMAHAGGDSDPAKIQRMVNSWIWADRIRFVINLVGYFFLLRAFRISGRTTNLPSGKLAGI